MILLEGTLPASPDSLKNAAEALDGAKHGGWKAAALLLAFLKNDA